MDAPTALLIRQLNQRVAKLEIEAGIRPPPEQQFDAKAGLSAAQAAVIAILLVFIPVIFIVL